MTKTVLYYTLRKFRYGKAEIVGVTSEKPGRYYGHEEPYKITTHGKTADTIGRFATLQAARDAASTIEQIKAQHKLRIEAAKTAYNAVLAGERKAIDEYIKALGDA
jgi:hypothetical protein